MATFKQFLDGHPVIIGSDGLPLSNGKLFFYDVGTTNLKTVYTDSLRTTPSDNPLLLNNAGRTETQIFLGYGQYTVHAYKFNGTDPITADPSEWSLDNEFDLDGLESAVVSNQVHSVDTIDDLRNVDQGIHSTVLVLGYYAKGDIYPRLYNLENTLASDNGGTIVKKPSIGSTAWIYKPEGFVDVGVFGVIGDNALSCNSQLSACGAWCYLNYKTMRIPSGIYKVSAGVLDLFSGLYVEENVKFNVITSSSYRIKINGEYDIKAVSGLKYALSAYPMYLEFEEGNKGNPVDARWYGAAMNNIADDGSALLDMAFYIHPTSDIIFTEGTARIDTLSSDLVFNCKSVIWRNAVISNQQSVYNIKFKNCEFVNENIDATTGLKEYGIVNANLTKYYFEDCGSFPASLFSDNGSNDMSLFVKGLNAHVNQGQQLTIDCDVLFDSEVLYNNADYWSLVWEKGQVTVNNSYTHIFNGFTAPQSAVGIITGYTFGVFNGSVQASWYSDIRGGLYSAIAGGSALDLGGGNYTIGTALTVNVTAPTLSRAVVKNGTLTVGASMATVVTMSQWPSAINFDNVSFVSIYDTTFLATSLTSDTGLYIRFTDCEMLNYVGSPTKAFITAGSNIWLERCKTQWKYIVNDASQYLSAFTMANCSQVWSGNNFNRSTVTIGNSKFIGGAGYTQSIKSVYPAEIIGNAFVENYVTVNNYFDYIFGQIVGNSFHSTNTQACGVVVTTSASDTVINGLVVTGNRFSGTLSSPTDVITIGGAGTYSGSANHRLDVSNNTKEDSANLVLKQTIGNSFAYPTIADFTSMSVGDEGSASISFPSNLLQIPAINQIVTVHAVIYSANGSYAFAKNFAVTSARSTSTSIDLYVVRLFSGGSGTDVIGISYQFKAWGS